ncbi:VRR-NUC domain-containing protein [Staphylococcus pseudintermedius]|uniref:VRR-NUC domain-containing protein n=1 Tax=Staphylococcus pseudintermedius TaxID=283734 RepID=UPI00165535B9|nr:VRR-NUC domain-containing protein [Staphylococcus pseudintermedius]MBC8710348.1 VRR-NUC domain-containing protein [Staphylococcus pseudintermedius]
MRESNIEKYLVREVRKKKGLCLKWVAPGTKGVPDRIVIMPKGKTYYVEMKQPKGRTDPLQKYMHKQLEDRGHQVFILWDKKQVDEFIEKVGAKDGNSV